MKNVTDLDSGYFLFSLDTELAWGWFDKFQPNLFSKNGQKERHNITRILDLLDEYEIIATWAVVGHLFYDKCEECFLCPIIEWKGKYQVFDSIYKTNHPLWYGRDIIDEITSRKTPHEIALHGYTHKIFSEIKMTKEEALIEIQESIKAFSRRGIMPKTIVFPRNRIAYLELFRQFDFLCYRGEEIMPTTFSLPILGRVFRRYYSFFSLFYPPLVYDGKLDLSGLVNLPSSRSFFCFDRNLERIIEKLNINLVRLRNFEKAVEEAATQKKVVHIWAHPCEFQTEKDFDRLKYLFECVSTHAKKGSLLSIGMADLARKRLY